VLTMLNKLLEFMFKLHHILIHNLYLNNSLTA
jgi:hypothetical protein